MLSVFLENIVLNIPLLFYEYVATKAPPSDIWIKAWLKGPHGPRSFSVPLTAFVIDNQMVLR